MSKELATIQPQQKSSALAVMASRFNVEPAKLLSTLKSTVFKNATDDELLALVVVANEYGLNPLTKEIYAFPAKGGGIVPVISIDGWINRMNSNNQFDGIEFDDVVGEDGKPVKTTASIWRKDRSKPIKVTEYYAECRRNTEPWNTMPQRMLRHKALCQCVRVAFGFGGVYDEDEARDLMIRDVTPRNEPDRPKLFKREEPAIVQEPEPAPDPDLVGETQSEIPPPGPKTIAPTRTSTPDPTPTDAPASRPLLAELNERMDADTKSFGSIKEYLRNQDLDKKSYQEPANLPDVVIRKLLDNWGKVEV